jgi:hypothetical protein
MASDTDLIRPAQLKDGVVTNAAYTVAHAIKDWLADRLAGRAPKTVSTQREVLEPPIGIIGAVPLRELSAATVRSALKELAARDSMRRTCADRSGRSAGERASTSSGRRASCATRLFLCCPTTGWRSRRSAASWATVHRTLLRRSIATRSDRSLPWAKAMDKIFAQVCTAPRASAGHPPAGMSTDGCAVAIPSA